MDTIREVVNTIEANPATSALIGGLVLAAIGAYATYSASKKDRRRSLYADAYKAAIEWREMFYRLRRRSPDKKTSYELINHFHNLQQQIDFHSGWLGSISVALQDSYSRFVGGIKAETMTHIHKAWDSKPVKAGGRIKPDEPQPNHAVIKKHSDSFLKDVRRYQSALVFRRLPVVGYFYWNKTRKRVAEIQHYLNNKHKRNKKQ